MKIKTVKTNSNTWYDLNPGVSVMTNEGPKICTRFYFNGFHKTKIIFMEDGTVLEATNNHQLMINENWTRVDAIVPGDVFNNGLTVLDVQDGSVKPTMDMEVPDVHYYLLPNGVMSHNSSFIIGQVSEGIEPHKANYYIKDLAKGKFTIKNTQLQNLLESKGKNTSDVWDSILKNKGSVQHLDFLTDREKSTFKTFREISPTVLVEQAADRQYFIDQGQSLNLIISPTTPIKEVNKLYIDAWKMGIKSFYYQISVNAAQEFSRQLDCVSCEA